MTTEAELRWQRSAVMWSEKRHTLSEDWVLIDDDGELLARIFDAGSDDGFEPGTWRWRIYRRDRTTFGGSAESGNDAKKIAEEFREPSTRV